MKDTWRDELLVADRVVRTALGARDGETLRTAARRCVSAGGITEEVARAVLEAEPHDSWGGLRIAVAILNRHGSQERKAG
jgi:hypothetical protein